MLASLSEGHAERLAAFKITAEDISALHPSPSATSRHPRTTSPAR
jgi:hypothetical protein